MVLYKNKTGKYLVYFQILYVLFYNLLISMLGFPSSISYLTDLVTVVLFLLAFKKISKTFKKINYFLVITLILLYISFLLVGDILNLVSPLLVIWAFRNSFRLIVFFICCVCFLDKEDIDKIMNMFYKVSWMNFAVVLIQYFVFGYSQDNLGGIFGTIVGCNGALNCYCCIIFIWFTCAYFNKKVNILTLLYLIASTLIIASLAEITVLFVEVFIILITAILLNKPSFKVAAIILGLAVPLKYSLQILEKLYPYRYASLQSLNGIIDAGSQAGGTYQISRLTAIQDITNMFFSNDWFHRLFGYGFGACEYSASSMLISDFYRKYGFLNYRWFDVQIRFLETGYIGLILYLLIFVVLIILAIKNRKKLSDRKDLLRFAIIILGIVIISSFYNQTLRAESGYLLFFALAIVPVYLKSRDSISVKQ